MSDPVQIHIAQRYLELLKAALTFTLWPEPLIPIAAQNKDRPFLKRWLVTCVDSMMVRLGLCVCKSREFAMKDRLEGRLWPSYADTMIGMHRLNNIQYCFERVVHDGIPGDLIETGVWRGGACIFMRGLLAAYGDHSRRVFVADSFAGLPRPDVAKYPVDQGDRHYLASFLAVDEEAVKNNFRRYGLLDDQVVFLKGWFKDTLPTAPIRQLAIMRLDGDMYGSTMESLTALYPRLVSGGYCIIDDYDLAGCRQAVDDFRTKEGICEPLHEIDWTGRFWRKDE
jgi:hypothetical protein